MPTTRLIDKASLTKRRDGLIEYLRMKLDAGDWHAVQDAASDIREYDAQLELLEELERTHAFTS